MIQGSKGPLPWRRPDKMQAACIVDQSSRKKRIPIAR